MIGPGTGPEQAMKILFAIKRLDGAAGGAERVLACIASGLAARGHEVAILSFDPPGGHGFYPLDSRVHRIALGLGDVTKPSTFAESFGRIPALRKAIVPERPDVAIGFMHSMFVPLAFALQGTGIPVIASEHIVPHHYRRRQIQFVLLCAAAGIVQCITVTSAAVKKLYPAFMRKKIVPVANPVSLAARQADPAGPSRRVILNVGRLDPQKGQDILIDAFATLAPRFPDWHVRIVGEGALKAKLEEKIAALQLQNRVVLAGTSSNIAEEYAAAQLFAMPSLYESFGLATAEAMASGLPVAGFADCPGTNELVRDGENGLLARGRDRTAAFAATLEKLMADESMRVRLGRNGMTVAGAYRPDAILDQWETLIEKTVRRA
jgi:glycosyltransferase involved in cell wall biosynthesis